MRLNPFKHRPQIEGSIFLCRAVIFPFGAVSIRSCRAQAWLRVRQVWLGGSAAGRHLERPPEKLALLQRPLSLVAWNRHQRQNSAMSVGETAAMAGTSGFMSGLSGVLSAIPGWGWTAGGLAAFLGLGGGGILGDIGSAIGDVFEDVGDVVSDMLMMWATSSQTCSPKGAVFQGGNVIPFARGGGIVSRPTLFPTAHGRLGLMGGRGRKR